MERRAKRCNPVSGFALVPHVRTVRLRGLYHGVVAVVVVLTTALGAFGGFSGAGLL